MATDDGPRPVLPAWLTDLIRDDWPGLVAAIQATTGGTWQDSEDAAANAVVRALETGQHFDSREHLFLWLRRVARNGAIDAHRRTARTHALPDEEEAHRWSAMYDVAEVVLLSMEFKATWKDILALPFAQRVVLAMRVLDGKAPAAIAAELNLPVKLVKSRLAEARRTLNRNRAQRGFKASVALLAAWRALRRVTLPAASALALAGFVAAVTTPPASVFRYLDGDSGWSVAAPDPAEPMEHAHVAEAGDSSRDGKSRASSPSLDPAPETALLPAVKADARACVKRGGCAGFGPRLPPSDGPTVWVRVPGAAGSDDRYVYVQAPRPVTSNVAPWACDAVPDTAWSGCQPGGDSTGSPSLPGKKA